MNKIKNDNCLKQRHNNRMDNHCDSRQNEQTQHRQQNLYV